MLQQLSDARSLLHVALQTSPHDIQTLPSHSLSRVLNAMTIAANRPHFPHQVRDVAANGQRAYTS